MQKTLEDAIADNDRQLRIFAESMRDQAQAFSEGLQTVAKAYVDSRQAATKTYIDTQIPQQIINRVKPEALK
jgi:hypothetical protein